MRRFAVRSAPADEGYASFARARWPVLVRSAYLLGCSASDAEDVAQAALLQAYRYWERVSSAASPDAYVHRILVNEAHKVRSRSSDIAMSELPPHARDTDPGSQDWSQRIDVRRLLARLSVDHRAVLVLGFFVDLSVDDVARALDVSPGTVKSRTSRALQELRSLSAQTGRKDSHERP